MNFKIDIKQDVIDLIKIYNNYEFEVGGMLFGRKIFNKYPREISQILFDILKDITTYGEYLQKKSEFQQ